MLDPEGFIHYLKYHNNQIILILSRIPDPLPVKKRYGFHEETVSYFVDINYAISCFLQAYRHFWLLGSGISFPGPWHR